MSPTSHSLALLRKNGWIACVVEKWIDQAGIRKDAFGFGDILAASPRERRTMLVQTTSLPNVPARVKKIQGIPEAGAWLASGSEIEVHGWTLLAGVWRVKRVQLVGADMRPVVTVKVPRRTRNAAAWQPGELFG